MKLTGRATLIGLVIILSAAGLDAQTKQPADARKRNVAPDGISREQADAILAELKLIRQLLEKQQLSLDPPTPEPLRGKVRVQAGDMIAGSAKAPVTIVEFTDYQCPFCRDFAKNTFPALKRDFIDTGKLRFVAKDMPLDFHQNAQRAAESARCAAEQGKFWEMRDLLFQNHQQLSAEHLKGYAKQVGLNAVLFENCLTAQKFEVDVRLSLAQAGSLKISGTPAFLIGRTTEEGVEGEILEGAMPLEVFASKINQLLSPQP